MSEDYLSTVFGICAFELHIWFGWAVSYGALVVFTETWEVQHDGKGPTQWQKKRDG